MDELEGPELTKKQKEEILDEAREIVFRLLRGGFEDSFDDFVDAVAEACEDHDLEAALDPEDVANIIDEECASFQQEMDKWPAVTDNDKLTNAFHELSRAGIISRENFACCMTCGSTEIWGEAPKDRMRGYCFYHAQDTDNAVSGSGAIWLGYGAKEDGEDAALGVAQEIVACLEKNGLTVRWNGEISTRISVELDWKRRVNWIPARKSAKKKAEPKKKAQPTKKTGAAKKRTVEEEVEIVPASSLKKSRTSKKEKETKKPSEKRAGKSPKPEKDEKKQTSKKTESKKRAAKSPEPEKPSAPKKKESSAPKKRAAKSPEPEKPSAPKKKESSAPKKRAAKSPEPEKEKEEPKKQKKAASSEKKKTAARKSPATRKQPSRKK